MDQCNKYQVFRMHSSQRSVGRAMSDNDDSLDGVRRAHIGWVLEQARHDTKLAAAMMAISEGRLHYWMHKLGVDKCSTSPETGLTRETNPLVRPDSR